MASLLPLFDLPRLRELESLEAERDTLCARMQKLPPNSHKRLILQDKLKRLTFYTLKAEAELEERP